MHSASSREMTPYVAVHSGREFLAQPSRWPAEPVPLAPGGCEGVFTEIILPDMHLTVTRNLQQLGIFGSCPKASYTFSFYHGMRTDGRINGENLPAGYSIFVRERQYDLSIPPLTFVSISIAKNVLDGLFASLYGMALAVPADDRIAVRDLPIAVASSAQLQRIADFCRNDPAHIGAPEVQQEIIEEAMEVVAPLVLAGPAVELDRATGCRHQLVKRAREIMISRIDQPLRIQGICDQLGVSRRALQYGFQDVLGLSPLNYLRQLRLTLARRKLRTASHKTEVGDVINRCGFGHAGRFSAAYRGAFGELPSETLKRSLPDA